MATQVPGGPTAAPPDLALFLNTFAQLPAVVGEALGVRATDEERRILGAIIPVLATQLTNLANVLNEEAANMSVELAGRVNTLLTVTAAVPLAQSAMAVAGNLEQPVTMLALSDIAGIIKKIIHALADLFGISLPGIIARVLELIDELLNAGLGVGRPGLAAELIERHTLQIASLVELARLEEAGNWRLRERGEG
jgi:hypothetical protein